MIYSKEQTTSFHEQTFAFLIIEEKNNVLSITLNRPEKRNAFHQPLANELAYALAYAHYTNSVWAVVLKANGPVFCAGADLKAFAGISEEGPQSSIPMPSGMIALGDEFKGLHKPCIAQVHGDVYAGGFLMICGCTHVVAVEEAKFGLPEVKRGIWPMQVMASLLPLMSARDMLDLCMRAKTIDAAEAKRLGIVSDVVKAAELEGFVQGLIEDIKEQSPTAIRFGLEAFEKMHNLSEGEKHKYLQGMLMKVLSSKDAQEGLAAFREKRKAEWVGE